MNHDKLTVPEERVSGRENAGLTFRNYLPNNSPGGYVVELQR